MKNKLIPLLTLLALGTLAPAAEPADEQWGRMYQVMHGLPRPAQESRLELLKSLIDQGADVNLAIGIEGMPAAGGSRGDLQCITWPLDVAVRQARMDMVKLLLANGAKLHGAELAKATFAGGPEDSFAMVTALLQAGADANSRSDGYTALFGASQKGNKNSVKLLLAQPGLKLDEPAPDGRTALMTAAEFGHTEIVEMLLKAGANAGLTNTRGETAAALAQKTLARQQAIVEKQQGMVAKLQSAAK